MFREITARQPASLLGWVFRRRTFQTILRNMGGEILISILVVYHWCWHFDGVKLLAIPTKPLLTAFISPSLHHPRTQCLVILQGVDGLFGQVDPVRVDLGLLD